MPAVNTNALNNRVAKAYVADISTLSVPFLEDGTNNLTIINQLDALSYTRLASIIDLNIETDMSADRNEQVADDTGTILIWNRPGIMASMTWFESGETAALSKILGVTVVNQAGSPTNVAGESKGTAAAVWNTLVPFKLANKDGDNTIVSSIVLKQGATYGGATTIPGSDYTTYVGDGVNGELGYTYIIPTVAGKSNTIWADYTYTPSQAKLYGLETAYKSLPRLVVKIETDPDSTGKVGKYFLYDASIDGTVSRNFVDVARAGELPGSEISFMTNKQGFMVVRDEVF